MGVLGASWSEVWTMKRLPRIALPYTPGPAYGPGHAPSAFLAGLGGSTVTKFRVPPQPVELK